MNDLGLMLVRAVLLVPTVSAAFLALIPAYKVTARLNILASLATLVAALLLFYERPAPGLFLNLRIYTNSTFLPYPTARSFSVSTPTGSLSTRVER